jgi:hypothetical protein
VTPDRSLLSRLAASERGDIVLHWIVKLTVVLGVVGLLGFDSVAFLSAKVSTSDLASQSAMSASDSWAAQHDIRAAYDAAAQTARESGGTALTSSFRIDPDGTAHVTVRKEASTVMLRRIKALRHYGVVTGSGEARSVS